MKKGFSLIEVIIYIALFSILITAVLATAFDIIESTQSLNSKTQIHEELNFALRKIKWALGGASNITTPSALNPYTSSLSLTKYDGEIVDICLDASKIKIREGGGVGPCFSNEYRPLTTDNVKVTNIQFHYIAPSGGSPAGIEASTTINGLSVIVTKYIR